MTDVKNNALFDEVSCNKQKERRFIVGCYQIYREKIIPLCIKTRHEKTYLAMACHNTTNTWLIHCHLIFIISGIGYFNIKTPGMRFSRRFLRS